MGIFARIKKAWYDSIIWETIDEDFYDELEESLIMADLGAAGAAGLMCSLCKNIGISQITADLSSGYFQFQPVK